MININIGVGTSNYGSRISPITSIKLLKRSFDCGVNYIDTAPIYGFGYAEIIIGKFIKKYGIKRQNLIITTKFGLIPSKKIILFRKYVLPLFRSLIFKVSDKKTNETKPATFHSSILNISEIESQIKLSLSNLNTDYIDNLIIHNNALEYLKNRAIVVFLINLKNKGIIKNIGVSADLVTNDIIDLVNKNDFIDILQIPLSNYRVNEQINRKIKYVFFSPFSNKKNNSYYIISKLNIDCTILVNFRTLNRINQNIEKLKNHDRKNLQVS
jgi:aryl-alcohol dehydrogenase-like predicted oxidoreductase